MLLPDKILNPLLAHLAGEESFVFLETSKFSEENRESLLFLEPVARLSCSAVGSAELFFKKAQDYLDQGYFLAGWFAYEFGYKLEQVLTPLLNGLHNQTLAELGVFREPAVYNHKLGSFSGPLPFDLAVNQAPEELTCSIDNLRPSQTEEEYLARLARIQEYIRAGDTYQVNYTIKLLFDLYGPPESLYRALRRNQPVAYSAYLKFGNQRILSFSPELFFKISTSDCTVRPMKGTISRGRTLAEDCRQASLLKNDPKNRSENVMIVDLLRNDLGRLSRIGSIKTTSMFDIETYATLHQMTSTITGKLRDHTTLSRLFQALFPCGSVTGAPKIRTMEIIHELETMERGVYTGGIGFFSPDGKATFNVPIRTIVLNNQQGEIGIGSGIVHDSKPESEWRESLLKGRFLTHARPSFQLIETLLWQSAQGFWLLDLHIKRLERSAQYFDYPLVPKALAEELNSLANQWAVKESGQADLPQARRVRVLLAIDGGYEITSAPCEPPINVDLPAPAQEKNLPRVMISPARTDSKSVFLFHKTTLRDFYNQERQKAMEEGFFEVIFANEQGEITEGSISNIMIKKQGCYYTPPVKCGLLPGILRQYLLERHPEKVFEQILEIDDLKSAEAVYFLNSVRGLIQVAL